MVLVVNFVVSSEALALFSLLTAFLFGQLHDGFAVGGAAAGMFLCAGTAL